MPKSILILDDDLVLAKNLESEFKSHGYQPTLAMNTSEIPSNSFDYAVIEVRLVGDFGLNAIEKIKSFNPNCKIVVLSGYSSVVTAVEAVKRGAINYLIKPANFSQLETALQGGILRQKNELRPPSLSQIENQYIDYILIKNEGNITKTAKDLGIHRQSLQRKLKKYC